MFVDREMVGDEAAEVVARAADRVRSPGLSGMPTSALLSTAFVFLFSGGVASFVLAGVAARLGAPAPVLLLVVLGTYGMMAWGLWKATRPTSFIESLSDELAVIESRIEVPEIDEARWVAGDEDWCDGVVVGIGDGCGLFIGVGYLDDLSYGPDESPDEFPGSRIECTIIRKGAEVLEVRVELAGDPVPLAERHLSNEEIPMPEDEALVYVVSLPEG